MHCTAITKNYTLSLHDALPIFGILGKAGHQGLHILVQNGVPVTVAQIPDGLPQPQLLHLPCQLPHLAFQLLFPLCRGHALSSAVVDVTPRAFLIAPWVERCPCNAPTIHNNSNNPTTR